MSTIGKNIKKKRNEKGITQDQLAEKLHVTRQTVSSWEMGRTEPDVDTLTRLAEALKVSVEDLIYDQSTGKGADACVSASKKGIGFGCSEACMSPMTSGVLSPVVIFPVWENDEMDDDMWDSMIRHELLHN